MTSVFNLGAIGLLLFSGWSNHIVHTETGSTLGLCMQQSLKFGSGLEKEIQFSVMEMKVPKANLAMYLVTFVLYGINTNNE